MCQISKHWVIALNYEGVSFKPKFQFTHWLLDVENILPGLKSFLRLGWNDYSSNNLVFLYIREKANIKFSSVCIVLGLRLANEKKY